MKDFPYSVPCERELTATESGLLSWLLEKECPAKLASVPALRIKARCGCGKCPTILFIPEYKSDQTIFADYIGTTKDGQLVGVILWAHDDELTQLEAWSVEGDEVHEWPTLESLKPVNERSAQQTVGPYSPEDGRKGHR